MGKSRKHKGGNIVHVDCAKTPLLCPTKTQDGASLMAIAKAGGTMQKTQAAGMTAANKILARGGGRKKKGGSRVICPQPAAGSGGSISAGGSSAGQNMCAGVGTSQQQSANSVHDDTALNLSTAPPCNPFSGQCGGLRNIYMPKRFRRRSRRRRKTRRKPKRKTRRNTKRKTRRNTKRKTKRKRKRRS